MKLLLTSNYKVKSQTPYYPLAGYWYSIVDVTNTPFEFTYYNFYNGTINRSDWIRSLMTRTETYYPNISELRHARVLLNDTTCKISITLPKILQTKRVALILLYAIDGLLHEDYDYSDKGVVSSAEYVLDLNNLSMIACNPPEGEFINKSTNIIDLNHLPKCSLITDISDSTTGIHDSHYMSSLLDRELYSDLRLTYNNEFIESWSGTEAAKDKQGDISPLRLRGSMTMRTDKLVEL